MKALGHNKTVEQIRAKWKALKHLYKDKEYCNRKSGNDRKDGGEWDEELDELLKTRPSVKPLEYGVDSIESGKYLIFIIYLIIIILNNNSVK